MRALLLGTGAGCCYGSSSHGSCLCHLGVLVRWEVAQHQMGVGVIALLGSMVTTEKDQQMHDTHIEKECRTHLLTSENRLGHHKDDAFQRGHFLHLALTFGPRKLPKGIHGRLVTLFQCFEVEIPIRQSLSVVGTSTSLSTVEALEIPHFLVEFGVIHLERFRCLYLALQFPLEAVPFRFQGLAPRPKPIALRHDNRGNGVIVHNFLRGTLG
mmetsp:Transcript_12318/g.28524  ORF Transcript_12318/g.28524 Transcript_12318/m.28524 type:complete len:212 (-) Transcript_12318:703-1338(-)